MARAGLPARRWLSLVPGIFGLVGTIVGGAITWRVQQAGSDRQRREDKAALSVAIAAEIESYLDLMENRQHVQNAQLLIDANKAGTHTVPSKWMTAEEQKASAFPIFDANLPRLGLLGSILGDIATFHRRVAGVRATIINAMEGAYGDVPAESVAEIMERELELWKNAVALGRSVVRRLRDGVE